MSRVIETATVETLAAEVRVLMVGNRQITQSVARQLDIVSIVDVEPFGRVKLAIDGHEHWIIGQFRPTGALVIAAYTADFDRRESLRVSYEQSGRSWPEWVRIATRLDLEAPALPLIVLAGLR